MDNDQYDHELPGIWRHLDESFTKALDDIQHGREAQPSQKTGESNPELKSLGQLLREQSIS